MGKKNYMNLKTPDSTHLTARIKEIEYQLIKNLNWIPTDDQFVKIAASILHAALGYLLGEAVLIGAVSLFIIGELAYMALIG